MWIVFVSTTEKKRKRKNKKVSCVASCCLFPNLQRFTYKFPLHNNFPLPCIFCCLCLHWYKRYQSLKSVNHLIIILLLCAVCNQRPWYVILSLCREKTASASENENKQTTATEAVTTEVKFKERSTPKITFRSAGDSDEVAFKKRKLNPDRKRNIRQTDPNKASWSLLSH